LTAPLFFADADRLASAVVGDVVLLDGAEGRHAATVRRLGVGERLDLADGAGLVCHAEVTTVRGQALEARVVDRVLVPRAKPRVTVVQALAKGDRDDRAVETLTEVGVDLIVPWQAARSIVRWDAARADKGVARWTVTAREASKQARRPWLAEVAPMEATSETAERLRATVAAGGLAVVLQESATAALGELAVPTTATDVVLVVGPEGGISDEELSTFERAGATARRLGPTVLRTSTAGTVAAAIVMANSGRWNPS
jgi:16S rRNA (uracil1498-N3)-methyltransferase